MNCSSLTEVRYAFNKDEISVKPSAHAVADMQKVSETPDREMLPGSVDMETAAFRNRTDK